MRQRGGQEFFIRMKTEELSGHCPKNHCDCDAKLVVFGFIDDFYNKVRLRSFLDYVSPGHYERLHEAKLAS